MSRTESRSRTVVFRLTEKEYVALKRACSRAHRSVSEFARLELLFAIHSDPEDGPCQDFRAVGEKLSKVQSKLEELKELLLCNTNERAISNGKGTPEA